MYNSTAANLSFLFVNFLVIGCLLSLFHLAHAQNITSLSNNIPNSKILQTLIKYYPAVTPEFISNSTIVLKGDEEFMLKTENTLHTFWKAIDTVKHFGYHLDEVTESGMGSAGNPTRFYAIMSNDQY